MTISAKIIADSVSPAGKRLTTFELRYPRFIHAEELTHRILESTPGDMLTIIEQIADGLMYDGNLSRNASSSRAIPVERMIQDVIDDPAIPIHWGKNQAGMQAFEQLENNVSILVPRDYDNWELAAADLPLVKQGYYAPKEDLSDQFVIADLKPVDHEMAWLAGRDFMIHIARAFSSAGYHKQIVNRLLETWLHINVVVTATEWANFFKLRDHKDAQPEIHELARQMKQAMYENVPIPLHTGEWHLPYVLPQDWEDAWEIAGGRDGSGVHIVTEEQIELLKVLSVARCASVSYKTVDGKPMTLDRAQAIYDKLVKADVFHASPFEHQATPDTRSTYRRQVKVFEGEYDLWETTREFNDWDQAELHGNFVSWIQNRKVMEKQLSL